MKRQVHRLGTLSNHQQVALQLHFFCHSPGYKQFENPTFNYISENENILFVPVESVKD